LPLGQQLQLQQLQQQQQAAQRRDLDQQVRMMTVELNA
jgi:hypothetical protein